MTNFAYATLLTSDDYLPGAIVLANSLTESGTGFDSICLVTPETLNVRTLDILRHYYTRVLAVKPLHSRPQDSSQLSLLGRPELGVTLTKCHVWSNLGYDRVAFLDADTLVLQNMDDIFSYLDPESVVFAAAPDVGWPDCFNSGVFVTKPSTELYNSILEYAQTHGSFDGADQGLLNGYFSSWAAESVPPKTARLPFTFNVTPSAFYSYLPALFRFGASTRLVHFIGSLKPWHWSRNLNGDLVSKDTDPETLKLIAKWWSLFDKYRVHLDLVSYKHLSRDWSLYSPPRHSQTSQGGKTDEFTEYKAEWNAYEIRRVSSAKGSILKYRSKSLSPTKSIKKQAKFLKGDQVSFEKEEGATATMVRLSPTHVMNLNPSVPTSDLADYHVSWNPQELASMKPLHVSDRDEDDELLEDEEEQELQFIEESVTAQRANLPTLTSAPSLSRPGLVTKDFVISKEGVITYK